MEIFGTSYLLNSNLTKIIPYPDYGSRQVLLTSGSITLAEDLFISCGIETTNSAAGVTLNGYSLTYMHNSNSSPVNMVFPAILCKKGDVIAINKNGNSSVNVWKILIKK